MTKRNAHIVQLILNNHRYVATEENGTIHLSRDGDALGTATWKNDQLIYSSTVALPDPVVEALEKKIKERMDANWDE